MPRAKCAARSSLAKIVAGEKYGFIETADGCEVYFHRNSVLDDVSFILPADRDLRSRHAQGAGP
jgi:hypothetical protein